MNSLIQSKWKAGLVVGHNCIAFGDGRIVMANTYVVPSESQLAKRYWFPLCDTTLDGLQKYADDVWTAVDPLFEPVCLQDQTIVFGEGAMGNEGFVASVDQNSNLNWSMFFTFSNPIVSATVVDNWLVCCGDSGTTIRILLGEITTVQIDNPESC